MFQGRKRSASASFGTSMTSRVGKRARAGHAGGQRRTAFPAQLRSVVPEVKTVDVPQQVQSITNAVPLFNVLNIPREGASFYNRVGRKIMMKTLELVGSVAPTGANTNDQGELYHRLMVVYDRQPNGAAPSIADLLLDYDLNGGTTTNSMSGINMNNRDRFVVFRDLHLLTDFVAAAGATPGLASSSSDATLTTSKREIRMFIKLRDFESHYKATAGSIGDLATGALYFVLYNNDLAPVAATWQVQWKARLRYHDV